jgi:hypothetical protein
MEEECKQLLDLWLTLPENTFKYTGPYWEALKLILKKYAPEEFEKYENFAGPFEYENGDVLKAYDLGEDESNFTAALEYMTIRQANSTSPDDVHIAEIDGEDYAYIPNTRIDQNEYFGREQYEP